MKPWSSSKFNKPDGIGIIRESVSVNSRVGLCADRNFVCNPNITPLLKNHFRRIRQLLIHDVLDQMAQLGKNQFPAGQFAGIQTARHAKRHRIFDNTGDGAR